MTVQIIAAALGLCAGCDAGVERTQDVCTVVAGGTVLPEAVREASGIAVSSFDPTVLWTHNDRNNAAELFAVDAAGQLVARVRVTGAVLVDWEDLERAPCDAGSCLYIGDIGDNDAARASITIYEVPEPRPGDEATRPATAFSARYPDGARDAEALLVDSRGDIYIITKGRTESVALYRLSASARGSDGVLEKIRDLAPRPSSRRDWVTSAAFSTDGRWVVMRTYRTLFFFPADSFITADAPAPIRYDLTPLGEPQGEGVAMGDDGMVWLTSEAGSRRGIPTSTRLRCAPAAP